MKTALIVIYLVNAIAMITFIMLQRGSGAAAGSGFGSGASGTVFGARGSSNFLSKATKWLAVVFFALSMGMAVYEARMGIAKDTTSDLGVMSQVPTPATPAGNGEVPAAADPAASGEVPTATTSSEAPSVPATEVPAASAPAAEAPAASADPAAAQTSETPAAEAGKDDGKPQ